MSAVSGGRPSSARDAMPGQDPPPPLAAPKKRRKAGYHDEKVEIFQGRTRGQNGIVQLSQKQIEMDQLTHKAQSQTKTAAAKKRTKSDKDQAKAALLGRINQPTASQKRFVTPTWTEDDEDGGDMPSDFPPVGDMKLRDTHGSEDTVAIEAEADNDMYMPIEIEPYNQDREDEHGMEPHPEDVEPDIGQDTEEDEPPAQLPRHRKRTDELEYDETEEPPREAAKSVQKGKARDLGPYVRHQRTWDDEYDEEEEPPRKAAKLAQNDKGLKAPPNTASDPRSTRQPLVRPLTQLQRPAWPDTMPVWDGFEDNDHRREDPHATGASSSYPKSSQHPASTDDRAPRSAPAAERPPRPAPTVRRVVLSEDDEIPMDAVQAYNPKQSKKKKTAVHTPEPAQDADGPNVDSSILYITDPSKVKKRVVPLSAGDTSEPWLRGPVTIKNFTVSQRPIITTSWRFFRAWLVCRAGFLLALEDQDLAQQVLEKVLAQKNLPTTLFSADATTLARKCIAARAPQVRSEMKSIAREVVPIMYNLRGGLGAIASRVAKLLKKKAFHGIAGKGGGLMYAHPIFEVLIQRTFFKKPSSDGVKYYQLFDPIPLKLLALVAAVVKNTLDEWATGDPIDKDFSAEEYQHVYEQHLKTLLGVRELCRAQGNSFLLDWQALLARRARSASRAKPLTQEEDEEIPDEVIQAALEEYDEHGELPDQALGAYVDDDA